MKTKTIYENYQIRKRYSYHGQITVEDQASANDNQREKECPEQLYHENSTV